MTEHHLLLFLDHSVKFGTFELQEMNQLVSAS